MNIFSLLEFEISCKIYLLRKRKKRKFGIFGGSYNLILTFNKPNKSLFSFNYYDFLGNRVGLWHFSIFVVTKLWINHVFV